MRSVRAAGQAAGLPATDAHELLDRQTEVLELIATAAPLAEVLSVLLTSLEHLMPGARCSVLLLDRERGTLHHGAAPTLPPAYVAAIDGMSIGTSAGSCGTAAMLNTAVVAVDVQHDLRWVDYRHLAQDAGLRSCWSTPIEGRDGLPVGTFAVYHVHPHDPDEREQLLVDRFTHLAAVAIDHARLQVERQARLEAETARRTAEELARTRSELLAAVGHEARTPIQAIVGFAELLGSIDLDLDRRTEALHHITAAAGHVVDLLTDVLDLSRIEANALPMSPDRVALAAVVDEAVGVLSARALQSGFSLRHEVGDDVVVWCDRRRLRQVLLNLLTNSVRHGRLDGSAVVRCAPSGERPGEVLVTIHDDGPGIPEELLPRIFTPYAHGTPPPDRTAAAGAADGAQEESIGLGLALAFELSRAMGGDLSVGRTGPDGTVMHLRLPSHRA